MATADPGGLHAAVGGQVGRAERQALHPGRRPADLLDAGHTLGRLEDGVHEDGPIEAGLGLELGEQPVDVVDVLGPLDLGDHDHVEGVVADLGDRRDEVVESPRRVERVHPGPELGVAELSHGLADLDQAGAGRLLVACGDAVLEVGEQHVDLAGHVGHLRAHLLVRRREEVDHPRRPDRDLPHRIGGTDGQGPEEVLCAAHGLLQEVVGRRGRVIAPSREDDRSLASARVEPDRGALGFRPVSAQVPLDLPLKPVDRDPRSIGEWLTTFHMAAVVLDPYTYESAWILDTAGRISGTSGRRLPGRLHRHRRRRRGPQVPRPDHGRVLTLCDPDRALVKAAELEQLPAFLHITPTGLVAAKAEGWDPAAWREVAVALSKRMSWSYPLIPAAGDPVAYAGSPALNTA
jgi:hypothetical protein